ncbi:MAG: hypothetical protein KF708_02535 [Pirellulales bacterium]|nr:hypothetical protein [Pirellulales bacterium]
MTIELDVADDFRSFDALEGIVLRSRSGLHETAIARALRRSVTRREAAPSAGFYTQADTRWHFESGAVETEPEVGGTILDATGRIWRVLGVSHETLSQRWTCWSRELSLAGGLTDVITIQQAAWTKGEAGALVASWSDYLAPLRARVQPEGSAIATQHRLRSVPRRYRVYLAEEVAVDANHRIMHGSEIYHVLGFERPSRIDELFVILAEQTPWPLGGGNVGGAV